MIKYDTPCKGCKERQIEPVNCHTVCERYRKWLESYRYDMNRLKQLKKLGFKPNGIYK